MKLRALCGRSITTQSHSESNSDLPMALRSAACRKPTMHAVSRKGAARALGKLWLRISEVQTAFRSSISCLFSCGRASPLGSSKHSRVWPATLSIRVSCDKRYVTCLTKNADETGFSDNCSTCRKQQRICTPMSSQKAGHLKLCLQYLSCRCVTRVEILQ